MNEESSGIDRVRLTSQGCRDYFAGHGLSYADVRMEDVWMLHAMLAVAVRDSSTVTIDDLRMSKKQHVSLTKDGRLRSAYLYVDGCYFEGREAVSFNGDGFIGFCGWASDANAAPIYEGFASWVDWIVGVVR